MGCGYEYAYVIVNEVVYESCKYSKLILNNIIYVFEDTLKEAWKNCCLVQVLMLVVHVPMYGHARSTHAT